MKRFTVLLLLSGLAGCGGIGQGSTVQTLKIAPSPIGIFEQGALLNADTPSQTFRMYDCFCSNIAALAYFTDGTIANFSYRVHFSSSDPSVVDVLNVGDANSTLCPLSQQGPGLLIPKATSGSAVITATFASLSASFNVTIVPTDAATLVLEPTDTLKTGAVGVDSNLQLQVTATIDHQPRLLSNNVTTWSLTPADTTHASISSIGTVRGLTPDQGDTVQAGAAFGTCAATPPALRVRVGEVSLLDVAEEPGFTDAADHSLEVNNNEFLQLTGTIDYQDPAAPVDPNDPSNKQVLDTQATYDFREDCTLRSFSDTPDGSSTLAGCVEAPGTCLSATPQCSTVMTACTSGMATCRTDAAPMAVVASNRIVATHDSGGRSANFFATFPARPGAATTLAADAAAGATTLTVAALSGYPTPPFQALLDKGQATQEVVQVSAIDTTALTVTLAAPTQSDHTAATGTFEQRTVESDQAPIQAVTGTLQSVQITPPGSMSPLGTLQLDARGTFQNPDTLATRGERVSHLTSFVSGAPGITWSSSNPTALPVSINGLVTSLSACGGQAVIRARSSSSTNTVDTSFLAATAGSDTSPQNGNDDANDAACGESGAGGTDGDALCDQVTITIPTPAADQLPPGVTCP